MISNKFSVTITRPNDTTAYAARDAIGDTSGSAILTFSNVGKDCKSIMILGATLEIDVNAIPSGMSTFTLELYSSAPTAIADNAAWDLPSADRSVYLGAITITTPTDKGSTLFSDNDGINKKIVLTGPDLKAVLVTDTAFTPSASTVKVLTLNCVEYY